MTLEVLVHILLKYYGNLYLINGFLISEAHEWIFRDFRNFLESIPLEPPTCQFYLTFQGHTALGVTITIYCFITYTLFKQ